MAPHPNLQLLHETGVSIWLDTLSRELLRSGEFRMNPPKLAADNVKRNTFSSRHPGGANFVLADGSVRFISETINHTETPYVPPVAWATVGTFQRLCSRNDGQTLGDF